MKKVRNKKTFGILIFAVCALSLSIVLIGTIIGMMSMSKDNLLDNNVSDNDNKFVSQDFSNNISGTVELNMSKDMIALFGEDFDYTLTQEQKDNGFTEIKKNDDGSATYTIKKKEYEKYIGDLKKTAKQGIDELVNEGSFLSIKSITYNDDLSKIVITANKEGFENSLDSMAVLSCGLTSCMYQIFDINASGKCTVEVRDSESGKVFQTTMYPDAMQK